MYTYTSFNLNTRSSNLVLGAGLELVPELKEAFNTLQTFLEKIPSETTKSFTKKLTFDPLAVDFSLDIDKRDELITQLIQFTNQGLPGSQRFTLAKFDSLPEKEQKFLIDLIKRIINQRKEKMKPSISSEPDRISVEPPSYKKDDTYLFLSRERISNVIRIACIDGIFHCILKAIYPDYANSNNPEQRIKLERKLRQELADSLPRYYSKIKSLQKYSEEVLKITILESVEFPDPLFEYFSRILDLNIILVQNGKEPLKKELIASWDSERPTIIITVFYELIGIRRGPGKIQTWFESSEPLVSSLR